MPVIDPNDNPPVPVLKRVHLAELERMIQEIIDSGGFGEVTFRVKKGRVYSLVYQVEVLCMEAERR